MISSFVLGTILLCGASPVDAAPQPAPEKRLLTIDDVASLPSPGTIVPTAIGFAPDGRSLTYLLPERPGSTTRVLWRLNLAGGLSKVVARPPGVGETDATVSPEEALRRERQRVRESGITAIQRAWTADLAVTAINGDLFLARPDTPLERLTQSPEPKIDPQLSPDGSKVAFVQGGELFVLNRAEKSVRKLTSGAVEGLSHALAEFMAQEEMGRSTGFWWSPDGSQIAFQETDERDIPLFTIAHEGTPTPSVETHRYPFSGKANAKVRLGVVNVSGGPTRWLTLAETGEDFYLARVTWENPQALLVQVLPRNQKSLRLIRINVANNMRTTVLEEKSDAWVNLHDDLNVLPTGEILWTSERSGYRHIELVKPDGTPRKVVTLGSWMVDSIVGVDPVRREVWFLSGRANVTQAQLCRVSLDGGDPLQITLDKGTHKATVAPDGNHFVDIHSSVTQPPRTTLRDRSGKILATIDDASADPRLAELSLATPEIVEFRSRDGVRMQGAFLPPKSGGNGPLIVLLYGGPHVQYVSDSWNLTADLKAQNLAQLGFAVWKMDNRGSSRRGVDFESALNRRMGTVEVQDQVDGVHFAASKWSKYVDPNRVGVNGRSYGGYMTLRCLTEAPDVFRVGVAEAPVTDWDGYDTCYTERYMGTPANNLEGYRKSSVIGSVGKLRGRLLIMHGLIDENVHFRHTARLIQALIEAGKPFEVLPVPEERHSSRKPSNRRNEADRIVRFFQETLAPVP